MLRIDDRVNAAAASDPAVPDRGPDRTLALGAPVASRDGRVGRLERVLLDPRTGRASYLVVAAGFPRHRDVLVPVAFLDAAGEDGATLRLTSEEFARLRDHTPPPDVRGAEDALLAELALAPPPGRRDGEVRALGPARAIEEGATVWCDDGPVGRVDRVLVDAAGRATGLVVRSGRFFATRRLVTIAWVDAVTADLVVLRASRAELLSQPELRSDEEILADVRARLEDDDPIRALGLRHAAIAVANGRVTLSGHVRSRLMARRMVDLARGVRGVVAVDDRLVADDELEVAVAAAIGRSPLNRTSRLRIRAEFGRVSVGGVFPSRQAREEALRIAATIPGVARPTVGLLADVAWRRPGPPNTAPEPARRARGLTGFTGAAPRPPGGPLLPACLGGAGSPADTGRARRVRAHGAGVAGLTRF
jgi:osmotically-inducible protein OsmY